MKRTILDASYLAHACHIGSALSCVGIIYDIFQKMKQGDMFIFSKASGAAAYYAVLAREGKITKDKIPIYLKEYPLSNKAVPGVLWSGGSLGHGLPVAVGLAKANPKNKVFVLMGDSEIQEGTTWESLLFAAHHKIFNLKVYVDRNRLQACGRTEEICRIDKALKKINDIFPLKIVKTIKGDGVNFMEGDYRWHYFNLDEAKLKSALEQI